jgi:hypothetical protein
MQMYAMNGKKIRSVYAMEIGKVMMARRAVMDIGVLKRISETLMYSRGQR